MSKKTIWIKVEEPDGDELKEIGRTLEQSFLGERYEIIVTEDGIDTMTKGEVEDMIDKLKGIVND